MAGVGEGFNVEIDFNDKMSARTFALVKLRKVIDDWFWQKEI